ncbi:MAG: hypothetical protein KA123_01570 [Candidatus Eisenbacteria bacterium]|nr:hypothetical protein [Candidatus Eisenbacteria bacterium]
MEGAKVDDTQESRGNAMQPGVHAACNVRGGCGSREGAPRGGQRTAGRLAARRALFAFALAVALGACAGEEGPIEGRQLPLTYLAVQGESLNVVNYHLILNWGGTDADGFVIGYAYRWDGPWAPMPGDSLWWEDPGWTFTTATRDTFDVPVVGSYAERTFHIRAIDDDRQADPIGASQRFRLENAPPIVSWSDVTRHPTLAHPSLPAVSFAWKPEDYDGRATVAEAVMWLDTLPGEPAALSRVTVIGDTVGAFFPAHFQGRYGARTAYLQIFDRARTPSNTISWTWTVVAPQGEYLLIDNAWPTIGPGRIDDIFWRARMDAVVPGNYHIYDVETEGPFRSPQEALPLFSLFRGVVWYGIQNYSGSTTQDEALRVGLERAQDAIAPYMDAGGHLLVSALNAVGTAGALSDGFCRQVFGAERIYAYRVEMDYVTDLTLNSGSRLGCGPLFGGDTLQVNARLSKTDCFALGEALEPLLWANPGTLDTTLIPIHAEEPVYLGALARRGEGSFALFTTLLSRCNEADQPGARVDGLLREMFAR